MDYELDTYSPSSRRSRPLAWLAAASGLVLVLFALGSPQAATLAETQPVSAHGAAVENVSDPVTTSSIVTTSPVKLVDVSAADSPARPLPLHERHLLIVLLFACFTVMSVGGFALWKRGWRDVVQRSTADNR